MRRIEEVRKLKYRRPFEPFLIRLEDGRELRIVHPDGVAWDLATSPRRLVAIHENGWDIVEMGQIASVRVPR